MTGIFPATEALVIVDGQSLNDNPFGAESVAWPAKLVVGYPMIHLARVFRNGFPWENLEESRYQRVDPKVNAALKVILSMMGGQSDIIDNISGEATYATEVAYAQAAKAARADLLVVNFTLLPISTLNGPQETERLDRNARLLANAEGAFDRIVDVAANPLLQDPDDATYFVEGLHLAGPGHTEVADDARPGFLDLLDIAA